MFQLHGVTGRLDFIAYAYTGAYLYNYLLVASCLDMRSFLLPASHTSQATLQMFLFYLKSRTKMICSELSCCTANKVS